MKTGNYFEFLKCLSLFAQDVISKGELNVVLGDLLVRHPDLAVRSSGHCLRALPACLVPAFSHV